MKYRSDFVTNSSSSSFIFAMKNDDIPVTTDIKWNPILKTLFDKLLQNNNYFDDEKDAIKIATIQDLDRFFLERERWYIKDYHTHKQLDIKKLWNYLKEDEQHLKWCQDRYKTLKKYIDDGYTLYQKTLSHHDDAKINFIYALESANKAIIIEREE